MIECAFIVIVAPAAMKRYRANRIDRRRPISQVCHSRTSRAIFRHASYSSLGFLDFLEIPVPVSYGFYVNIL